MKPEVRRAFAKEWLILMAIALVVTFSRVGWFFYKNDEIERRFAYDFAPIIEELSGHLVKADAAGNTKDAKALADAIRQTQTQKEVAGFYKVAADRERMKYPSPLTKQFWSVSATWAVEWSWLAYLGLWVPRLTVGSIRLLSNSANKTTQP